ncbi:MAG: hypothetical protein ABI204_08700 [Ginsengibacter sp.]
MKKLKYWYYGLSTSKKLAVTFSMQLIYWFGAWLFFDRMVSEAYNPFYYGLFFALCMALGLTIIFERRKIKNLFKKEEEIDNEK